MCGSAGRVRCVCVCVCVCACVRVQNLQNLNLCTCIYPCVCTYMYTCVCRYIQCLRVCVRVREMLERNTENNHSFLCVTNFSPHGLQ